MLDFVQFVDMHCHLLPGIDDGARNWDEALAMARLAKADGIETVIATPHQLGTYRTNDGRTIRARVAHLREIVGHEAANVLCCHNPAALLDDGHIESALGRPKKTMLGRWFGWKKAS